MLEDDDDVFYYYDDEVEDLHAVGHHYYLHTDIHSSFGENKKHESYLVGQGQT